MSDDFEEVGRPLLKWFAYFFALCLLVSLVSFAGYKACRTVDYAIINYEEFQEIYNTCEALNRKICNIRELPDDDASFKNHSKGAQINGLRNHLARWTEEYNAKSRMWNRSMWKSSSLPYSLSVDNYSCYQSK